MQQLIFIISFSSLWVSSLAMATDPKMEYLIMYYGMGDNNLSQYIWEDTEEMTVFGSSKKVAVVAQLDLNPLTPGVPDSRFLIPAKKDADNPFQDFKGPIGRDTPIQTFEELDSGSATVLADFIAWATDSFSAKTYVLVLAGHGYGYSAKIRGEKTPATERQHTANASSASPPSRCSGSYRYFSHDEHPAPGFEGKSILTTKKLKEVLENQKQSNKGIAITVADSCVSQTLANGYELRDVTELFIASQQSERAGGHDWTRTLRALNEASGQWDPTERKPYPFTKERFAKGMILGYIRQNLKNTQLSAIDLSRIETVVENLKTMVREAQNSVPKVARWLKQDAIFFGGILAPKIWLDLWKMAFDWEIHEIVSPATAQRLRDSINGEQGAVISNKTKGPGEVGSAHGLNVTFPGFACRSEVRPSVEWEIQVELGIEESPAIAGPLMELLHELHCTESSPCKFDDRSYVHGKGYLSE